MVVPSAETRRLPRGLAILLVSLAGLLLEVGYTRIVSYKLWYYYTFFVIGLALLGIGSGGVFVAVWRPVRRWATDRVLTVCGIGGGIVIALSYLVVARTHVDTIKIWDYGTLDSFKNLARLGGISFAIFAAFIPFGIIVSVLLGRAGEHVGRVYFADLLGAGLGCMLAIPLISRLSPPRVVMIAALVFVVVGIASTAPRSLLFAGGVLIAGALIVTIAARDLLPDVYTETGKEHAPVSLYSAWGPVFRVDVVRVPGGDDSNYLLLHDGTFGSGIHRFNGDPATLDYSKDPRSIPFAVLGAAPPRELIIGSAGGNEILASLAARAPDVEAVELNPVTVSLLTKHFAADTGHLNQRPDVHLHQGDGRSYLARRNTKYNLVWYVAPDSYAATNAASAGALVLSESYLYTTQMIKMTLQHLAPDGMMVVQFGELDFVHAPNRTSRYIVTARKALSDLGIHDAPNHLLVAAQLTGHGAFSTIIVKRDAFTAVETQRFIDKVSTLPEQHMYAAPGHDYGPSVVSRLAAGSDAEVAHLVAGSPKNITAVNDDSPYFWHFARFRDVIAHIGRSLPNSDPENIVGERILLLLLAFTILYAGLFLLAPFLAVRRTWRALPAKRTSAVYFAALGLGFMFFEVTMIQRLVLYLGFPTYSLTVTLAVLLVSSGLGALASTRFVERRHTLSVALTILAGLTVFYALALSHVLDGTLSAPLAARVLIAVIVMFPLGLCLGLFMPLGLRRVVALTDHREEYVAWAWAVNGFFSVIGSVLTTILSMSIGYRRVQLGALVLYAIAAFAFTRLPSGASAAIALPPRPRPRRGARARVQPEPESASART